MSVDCLLDTNVLVYAAAGRGAEEAKRRRAIELIDNEDFGLSAQVLQEFYVTVVRKIEVPLSADQAFEWLEQFDAFPCVATDRALVKIAIELSERYQISFRDTAIVTTAGNRSRVGGAGHSNLAGFPSPSPANGCRLRRPSRRPLYSARTSATASSTTPFRCSTRSAETDCQVVQGHALH